MADLNNKKDDFVVTDKEFIEKVTVQDLVAMVAELGARVDRLERVVSVTVPLGDVPLR